MNGDAQNGAVVRLTAKEMQDAKALWKEIFFEDSDVFTDYYFQEKMQDNIGYGIKSQGRLVSMLYLTPYTGVLRTAGAENGFMEFPIYYIVGVGTKKEYRHRGCMDALLRRALNDIRQEGHPFTFLMPANQAIYAPYQFRYIYDRPEFQITEKNAENRENRKAERMREADAAAVAVFAEKQLRERYQFFLRRDEAYYIRQQKESRAQNGDIYLWKEENEIKGFYLYAKEDTEFIQEAVTEKDFAQKAGVTVSDVRKPIIMARIADVRAMLAHLRLKKEAPFEEIELPLEIRDELIDGNNGTFLWTVGKKESTIAMVKKTRGETVQTCIADLTEFLFGRKNSRECFVCSDSYALPDTVYERLSHVEVIESSFINEIV